MIAGSCHRKFTLIFNIRVQVFVNIGQSKFKKAISGK